MMMMRRSPLLLIACLLSLLSWYLHRSDGYRWTPTKTTPLEPPLPKERTSSAGVIDFAGLDGDSYRAIGAAHGGSSLCCSPDPLDCAPWVWAHHHMEYCGGLQFSGGGPDVGGAPPALRVTAGSIWEVLR
jgi:hypothetical protein